MSNPQSRVSSWCRNPKSRRRRRRGVLLLVVLSMLVLFMLIGTAFLMSSSQSRDAAKAMAKDARVGNHATEHLDRMLMTLLRDTENPAAVTRDHSLLRDFYGIDGFQGVAYKFNVNPADPTDLRNSTPPYITRFSEATPAQPLGPTRGQFIDIFFKALAFNSTTGFSENDQHTLENEGLLRVPDARHVLKLDRNAYGQVQIQTLPLTKGYYNGCLLTITSGPAAGQSARIVGYECVNPALTSATRVYRLRVMAFGRADGRPLELDPSRAPEIKDLTGASFIVNGRPFNGTGVGYNPLAVTGQARLTALEVIPTAGGEAIGAELALLPNARYFNPLLDQIGALPAAGNPFAIGIPLNNFARLNSTALRQPFFNYPTHAGPGDADEGYDAADFQNMWLALQTVKPRAQGWVVHAGNVQLNANDPAVFTNAADFLRLDLENVPLPSFHRPDLVNFWYHRLLGLLAGGNPPTDDQVRAVLQPYGQDGYREGDPNDSGDDPTSVPIGQRDLVAAIKRKIMLRPIHEDHPKFTGSNTQSQAPDLSAYGNLTNGSQIMIPFWESLGPWDVDNDNDGIADSVWLDTGEPVQELEDGTRYKVLVAPMIIDLDSRLNVNAHGLADHINPPNLAYAEDVNDNFMPFNLAGGLSSNVLATGLGYGPAEISLRPVFPIPTDPAAVGNRAETTGNPPTEVDSYATLLAGRTNLDGSAVSGKWGYLRNMTDQTKVAPGYNYDFTAPGWANPGSPTGDTAQPDVAAQLKFFDYPWVITQRTAFGTPPDLFGRYALGLDYTGQPYYEVLNDVNPATMPLAPANWRSNHLLVNSPYELDLSRSQRREASSAQYGDASIAFGQSLSQNDDAAFAPADMERVLRAWDADSSTLPSRLWDVVNAFDPMKLMQYDAIRVANISNGAFGSANQPERLAAAQQIAAINRRLVTTDSAGPPVPTVTPPAYVSEFGPDGQPGRAIYDASGNLQPSNPGNLNAPGTDDFRNIVGKDRAQSTIYDVLRYRVWCEVRSKLMVQRSLNEVSLSQLNAAQYQAFINDVSVQTAVVVDGVAAAGIPTLAEQILAPELLAGKRMDLNRPLGDGRDNAADGLDNNADGVVDEASEPGDAFVNGVVDDPIEAGEPFLDMNGNGRHDSRATFPPNGEPFINLDGSVDGSNEPSYTPPLDRLWQGLTAEPIAFDYTNGHAEPVHLATVPGVVGGVRNLSSQARQLYARHLYCLMLLLVDEQYIAPWDENDPQITEFLDPAKSPAKDIQAQLQTLGHPNAAQEARRIMLRKLTCRAIAQWAANCADMRDADAIMTPFEYDENPWDGWGCLDSTAPTALNIPLDGDAGTDENLGMVINWPAINATTIKPIVAVTAPPSPLNQTRGLVWGAERPELLMTETLAFHDRRTEDLDSDFTTKDMLNEGTVGDAKDNDQRLRPRGSVFIEIVNPWSPTGQYPAELYSKLTRNAANAASAAAPAGLAPSQGIELGRLSTMGVNANGFLSNLIDPDGTTTATVKRSPVWRVIVVEEHPEYRQLPLNDTVDDGRTAVHRAAPAPRYKNAKFFTPVDLDWSRVDMQVATANEPYAERSIYFTSDDSERFAKNTTPRGRLGTKSSATRGGNEWFLLVKDPADKLRLPPSPKMGATVTGANYFLAANPTAFASGIKHRDLEIAPVKPGRYALVGTAGSLYKGYETAQSQKFNGDVLFTSPKVLPRYVTTISRMVLGSGSAISTGNRDRSTSDTRHTGALNRTRRIEMLPYSDPDLQQVFIGSNGGTPLFPDPGPTGLVQRDNELVKLPAGGPFLSADKRFLNIFDGDDDANPTNGFNFDDIPDPTLINPCVAIPIANMSISEPIDIYESRRDELADIEKQQEATARSQNVSVSPKDHYWDPQAAEGDGGFIDKSTLSQPGPTNESPYDEPFDTAWELTRNGTTRNYRSLHLQRLADPTLPWNPLPTLPDGKPNPAHNASLPVNLYRTIDTASADLTAYNGASSREPSNPNTQTVQRNAWSLPGKRQPGASSQFIDYFGESPRENRPIHRLSFRSLERGVHKASDPTTGALALAPRLFWRQEPPMQFDATDTAAAPKYTNDMLVWRQLITDAERETELRKRVNDLRIRDHNQLDKDIAAIAATNMDADFAGTSFPARLKPGVEPSGESHHFDVLFEHSLGFQNEAFGALATRADIQQQGLPTSATGAPLLDSGFARSAYVYAAPPAPPTPVEVSSTFPWLAWGNRPFVSSGELLNVPGASSSQMLRRFSTIFQVKHNPYDGTGLDAGNPASVAVQLARFQSPFGHLLSAFQTALVPAGIAKDASGVPILDGKGNLQFVGAPHYYRILEYVNVPSRFVGTETMLTAEVFNDSPVAGNSPADPFENIGNAQQDPRYDFQPPFNRISRERDPGKVNLNTVTGRREPFEGVLRQWSEVFDGIMHRDHDMNQVDRASHFGPAWRDVVLSRRGYAQKNADNTPVDKLPNGAPDTLAFGLNSNFPSVFSNPFRSPDAGDLVPLQHMVHFGVDASWQRRHHFNRGNRGTWGSQRLDDDDLGGTRFLTKDDTREAGYAGDQPVVDMVTGGLLPVASMFPTAESGIPLFSESFTGTSIDGERNPYFYYQPMTRMENLVTNRSNVFAIWVTIGYFEVEPAPNWNDPDPAKKQAIRERFGATTNDADPVTIAGLALYNRVYPDGYMLGREIGSDTGDVKRPRGFYIVDRTEEVGFKPGEDLNVEKMIKLRRRIE